MNPARTRFHLLDKVISFDDAQEALFRLPTPIIVIGSASSGKTALTLEEWQREARRLALHGKEDQAEAIRREILHARVVPWEVLGRERYLQTLDRAFNPKEVSTNPASASWNMAPCWATRASSDG